jgi:hypothetical protein
MKRRRPESSTFLEAVIRNPEPDFLLQGAYAELVDTGNPYYAWLAVKVCVEHKRELPDWVLAYLGKCAERMLSDKPKKEGRDLRKALPRIFGFSSVLDSAQRKRGPGNMLDPVGDPDRLAFALQFGFRLEQGEQVPAAISNACNDVFDGKRASVDEKTLRRWLLKELNLKGTPKNADEWKMAVRKYIRPFAEYFLKRTKSRETLT